MIYFRKWNFNKIIYYEMNFDLIDFVLLNIFESVNFLNIFKWSNIIRLLSHT